MRCIKRLFYLSLFFHFLCTTTYPSNHYVDKNATGQNNGSSWANAWQSFSAINWGSIQPGDVVYFSGGTDSTVYYEQLNILNIHGTAANWITFRNSYDAGHNGRVILDGNNYTIGNGIVLGSSGSNTNSYIYIKGFESRCHSASGYAGITIRYPNNCITIDSCYIYDNRHYGINLFGTSPAGRSDYTQCTDSVTIKNCYITSTLEDASAVESDLIKADAVRNTVIDNCVFHLRRPNYSNSNHSDGIQALGTAGWTITNNFFIDDSACYSQANILSFYDFTTDGDVDSVIYYNNVFYEGGTWEHPGGTGEGTVFFMKREFSAPANTQPSHIVAINNTIISYGPNYSAIEMQYQRPCKYFKNNIIAQFGNGNNGEQSTNYLEMFVHNAAPDTIFLDDWDRNLWYVEWRNENWAGGSSDYWNGNGYTGSGNINSVEEMNSLYGTDNIAGDPTFQHDFSYGNHHQASIDAYTMDDFRNGDRPQFWMPGSGSPAINAGEDLQFVVEGMGLEWKDINGNPRDFSPTIGAYESDGLD